MTWIHEPEIPEPAALLLYMTHLCKAQVANGTQTELAAIYNMTDNTFVPFHIPESPFCSGHLLLPDGRGLVIGGEPLCRGVLHHWHGKR